MTDRPAAPLDNEVLPSPLSIAKTVTALAAGHPVDKALGAMFELHSKYIDSLDFDIPPPESAPHNSFLWLKGLMP